MRPHSEDTDDFFSLKNFIDYSVLNIYSAGKKSGQVTDEFFVRWMILEWVDFQDFNEIYHVML